MSKIKGRLARIIASATIVVGGISAGGRAIAAAIAPTDLVVFQQGDSGNAASTAATHLNIVEVNPALTAQTTPVQTFAISSQASGALNTASAASEGSLTLSDNNTLVTFAGYIGTVTPEANEANRGSGALDATGAYTQTATYTGSATAGNQTRSAFTPDGVNYYFGDKGGMFAGGGTTAVNANNVRSIKGFGSNTYVLQASNTAGTNILSTASPATPNGQGAVTLTSLPGLSNNNNVVDFALLSSGAQGAGVPDTLYVTSTQATTGGILKFGFNGTNWVAEGNDIAVGTTVSGITAASNGAGGANLFVTTSAAAGVLEEVTDSAGPLSTISDSTASVLYTAPTGADLRGVAFAPVTTPEPGTAGLLLVGGGIMALRRRRREAR